MADILYVLGFGLLFALLVYYGRYGKSVTLPLPPGPPGHIISGNMHNVPKERPWLKFTEWKDTYGPLVYLRIFNDETIVLNTAAAVQDILEARSLTYSDRPHSWMIQLIGRRWNVFVTSYASPRFKAYRRLLHHSLNPRATQTYRPILEEETNMLLENLRNTPGDFISHLRRNAGAMTLNITYGHKVTSGDDFLLTLIEERFQQMEKQFSKPFLVEFIPWLRFIPDWFPGRLGDFKRVAKEWRKMDTASIPFKIAKDKIEKGDHGDSLVYKSLESEREEVGRFTAGLDVEDVTKWCGDALYLGGADTTVSAMTTFFYVMATHPDVQKQAQDEIDLVVGTECLPTWDDKDRLPYLAALTKEINRWGTVAPRGIRHRAMKDDVYNGYRIPKGTTILANIWGICHDPELYPNPHTFDPERHLGDNPQTNPYKFTFGFGRRVCPGQHFAEQTMFLNMSNILATFNISKAKDSEGREVDPEAIWSTNITSHLKPFPCQITPRSR